MVLATLFEGRSTEHFFGASAVIDCVPFLNSESFALEKRIEICSLSHVIDVRPYRISKAASLST
jgi:hypothetical protein